MKTNVQFVDRFNFFKQLSLSGSYSLVWSQNKAASHKFDIVNITLFDLLSTTVRYDSLANQNSLIQSSLDNQLIVSSAYTFTFDKRINPRWPRGMFLEFKVENAGNLLNLTQKLITGDKYGDLSIFGAKTVQFTQFQFDYRYFQPIGPRNTFAFRLKSGLGFSYGNSFTMPYSHQYYLGGSSSMRPFTARTIGPGLYLEFDQAEVNQVGDLMMELNFEYRFKISPFLSGALWSDYGNIWLLNEDPLRPGSGIRWDRFYKDAYLTSGIGLRLDLNFIMIRADVGTIMYYPFASEGYKWVFQNKLFLYAPSIGFGFPF